ncbi:MAG: endonuclease/exonuclease/phosphatase family protein [Cytophagales bacterium]
MKVISWNSNCAFRNKFELLDSYDADILIIQECEDPASSKDNKYRDWATNYLWIGENKHKGLGVFAKDDISLTPLDWESKKLKYFIPCSVNGQFNLLGVWCYGAKEKKYSYIAQLWLYLEEHKEKFENMLIAGDFNSNSIWDNSRVRNHTEVVRELKEIEIESIYHTYFNENQGNESIPTLFFRKELDRPFHIDYMFGSSMFHKNVISYNIGKPDQWLKYSDHMPIVYEFE